MLSLTTLGVVLNSAVGAAFLGHLLSCRLTPSRSRPTPVSTLPSLQVWVLTCGEAPVVVARTLAACAPLAARGVPVALVQNSLATEHDDLLRELCATHAVRFVRVPHLGSKARVMERLLADCTTELVAFLDADEAPRPEVLLDLARALAAEPDDVAFVQGHNASVHHRWWQQCEAVRLSVYRNVVCEARDTVGRVHFLGTTAVHRRRALEAVGIPDWSVTEDNALSARLHFSGWRSRFHGVECTRGLPCESLPAWWRQQRRWAHGNLTVLGWVLRRAWSQPPRSRDSLALLAGYVLSGSFFAAATLWTLLLLGTAIAAVLGWVPLAALAVHGIWFLALVALVPGPRRLYTACMLMVGNVVVLPGYLAGCVRALDPRRAAFDVSVKDQRGLGVVEPV